MFVDVKNDMAFHKIFGNASKTEALISFINAILGLPDEKKITLLEILNPYQLPNVQDGKSIIIDIKARDNEQKEYIIEMQVADVESFDKRVLYYTSKNFADQIQRGESYNKLNPIIFIGILNFNYTSSSKYLSKHKILEVDTHESYLDEIQYHFVELKKFNKTENELVTLVDKWLYFIKNAENLEVLPKNLQDKGLENAYTDAAFFSWSKEELEAYDYMIMIQEDLRGREAIAIRKATEKATEKAIEKGMEKGMDAGVIKRSIEIAKKAVQKGYDNETIMDLTGLSIEEIEKMRNEN